MHMFPCVCLIIFPITFSVRLSVSMVYQSAFLGLSDYICLENLMLYFCKEFKSRIDPFFPCLNMNHVRLSVCLSVVKDYKLVER